MPAIAPDSPEARRAARKLLNGFMLLAGLNLLVIAFAFWPLGKTTTPGEADVPAMREVLDAAVKDMQRGDALAFYAHFATSSLPPDRAAEFARVYADGYGGKFGKVVAMKDAVPESGVLRMDVQCEKVPEARLIAHFARENERIKLTSLIFVE